MIGAIIIGFGIALGLGPMLIPLFERMRFGQTIRNQGPKSHQKKQGTPTMGGVLFLLPLLVTVPLFGERSPLAWSLFFLIIGHGLIGFADDYLKVVLKRPLGLRAREKLIFQLILAIAFVWLAERYGAAHVRWILPFGLPPFNPGPFYGPIAVLAILGTSNAVNLTDGLDGLAGGAAAVGLAFFAYVAVAGGDYALALVSLTLVGGLIGFLRFNLHPARIFMGDTGSLALGAALAGAAVISHTVVFLPVVGILFVVETLSVILQVLSFKLTGRRVFRMSPLHHHFELGGWTEERVVTVFWIIAVAGAAVAWWLRVPIGGTL